MKILLLADLQSVRYEEWQSFLKTDENSFDIVATLGDIYGLYLKQTRDTFPAKRIIGVLGNHDQKGKFVYYDIEDIHANIVNIDETKIGGIEGSIKYKDNEKFPLYKQEEIIEVCRNLKKADIIISHNSPYGIHDTSNEEGDIAHIGFIGLTNYIEKNKPKYCIHGHQHVNKTTEYLGTKVVGIHGITILDTDTGHIEEIFS